MNETQRINHFQNDIEVRSFACFNLKTAHAQRFHGQKHEKVQTSARKGIKT